MAIFLVEHGTPAVKGVMSYRGASDGGSSLAATSAWAADGLGFGVLFLLQSLCAVFIAVLSALVFLGLLVGRVRRLPMLLGLVAIGGYGHTHVRNHDPHADIQRWRCFLNEVFRLGAGTGVCHSY